MNDEWMEKNSLFFSKSATTSKLKLLPKKCLSSTWCGGGGGGDDDDDDDDDDSICRVEWCDNDDNIENTELSYVQ